MADRSTEEIAALTRRELAQLQANEMSAALNPFPGRPDDEIGEAEKAEMQEAVAALQQQHRRELAIWTEANPE